MDSSILREADLRTLAKTLVEYLKIEMQDEWIPDSEAMRLLNIKSKATLQKLRDERKIIFSQPQKKIILYQRRSLLAYIEAHASIIT